MRIPDRASPTRPSRRAVLAVLLVLAGCAPPPVEPAWTERMLRGMDLRQRAGQLVLAALPAAAGPAPAPPGDRLLEAARSGALGGVLVRQGSAAAVAAQLRALEAATTAPLLVALDLDRPGPEGLTPFPAARVVAVRAAPETARAVGEWTAREARALGATVGVLRLPPTNGAEPISPLARDPERVVRGLTAYLEGLREGGLLGGVQSLWTDTAGIPELSWDRARLDAIELRELEQVLDPELGAVAFGALRLPSLSGDSVPLPLSAAALDGVLRRDLGWSGAVAVDLTAESPLTRAYGPAEAAVWAVAAGADLLLGVEDPGAVGQALVEAVRQGRISRARLEAAAKRVLELKARVQDLPGRAVAPDSLPLHLGTPEALALAATTAPLAGAADSVPASLPGYRWPPAPVLREALPAEVGMSAERLAQVDRILSRAVADSVFTGAALAVGRRGGLVRLRGYGRAGATSAAPPIDAERTLFDIASLSKVVGTTSAAALLVQDGRLSLDAPLERYLPECLCRERPGVGGAGVRVRQLLTHTSGLPSGLWLFGSAGSPRQALQQVLEQPLQRAPGERMQYSDLGMILLAEAAERVAEMPLDRFLALHLFAPLGMSSTMYLPPVALRERVVPTALRTERSFALQGVVHDANAFRLGGVAGHAGLFSTARDLAVFAQTMLNGGSYGPVEVLAPGIVGAFTTRQPGAEQRALGWDTPSSVSSAGDYFSARSFGHTGYTGTSLWIDPEKELFVVLLTNRTYTEASSREMLEVRAEVHDAVARAVADQPVRRRSGAR